MKFSDEISLQSAKKIVEDNLSQGLYCPCCKQYIKQYKRAITSSMARCLIIFYQEQQLKPNEWLQLTRIFIKKRRMQPNDFTKFKMWKMIVQKPSEKEDGNPDSGFYMLTEKGKQFVMGKIEVPRHCWVVRDEVDSFSKEMTTIKKALRNKFDYNRLMNNEQ